MAYATVQDMIRRYGETEMVRLTTPADQPLDGIVTDIAETKLQSASAMIDSYVAKRYKTPMEIPPAVIVDICCNLARYDLSLGEQKSPSDQVRADKKDAMDWLRDVSLGRVVLDLDEVAIGDESYAQASTRDVWHPAHWFL